MRKILEKCPSCGGELVVTELQCPTCATLVRGQWEPCRFCQLDAETLQFIEVFVKNRGNLKEMERELAESYWTLRARLNQAIEALGLEVPPGEEPSREAESDGPASARRLILQQVQEGKIEAAEAVRRLSELSKE
ncbi:MAG: DUF2089 domain-containing protein [Chloroflexi bacterium]|nr:DUF2089 domain-containing protein [Chloroflexota bacterium]